MICPDCGDEHAGNELSPGALSAVCKRCKKDRDLMMQRAGVVKPGTDGPSRSRADAGDAAKPASRATQGSKPGKKH